MRIEILDDFVFKLADQVEYIARDKPIAARKFKKGVLTAIQSLMEMPFKNRKSIYFNDENN